MSTLAAACVGLGRRRLWMRLIVLCLIPTSVVIAAWLALARRSGWLARSERSESHSAQARPAGRATRPILRRVAKLATVLLSLVILLPPVATFCVLVAPAPDPPETVLPDPNGYHDLLRAGRAVGGAAVPATARGVGSQPQAAPMSLQEALDLARAAMDRECVVPLEYSMSDLDVEKLWAFRALGRAFLAEGKLAEMNGRPADAVEDYLNVIRVGQKVSRGGMIIDWLVGQAVEGIGVEALTELRGTLTPDQCRELIDILQTLDANFEPLEDVWARDELWGRVALDWKAQLAQRFSMIAGTDSDLRPLLQATADRSQAKLRLLICGLALRAYSVEKGHPPEKLADLVPEYLPEVPEDPYSGTRLVYRRNPTGYVLYSVGPDGRDDGGQPGPYGYGLEPGTDMLLDKPPEGQEE